MIVIFQMDSPAPGMENGKLVLEVKGHWDALATRINQRPRGIVLLESTHGPVAVNLDHVLWAAEAQPAPQIATPDRNLVIPKAN